MKIAKILSAMAASALLLVGCAKSPSSVSVSPSSLSLTEGETGVLEATVLPENAKFGALQWTSSDEKVATVSAGRVLAVGAGTATIKATAEGVSGTATVTVQAKYVPVEKVNVTDETGADRGVLNVGQTVQLKAQVLPANATDKNVTWSASTDCASVSASGLVTAVSLGDCVIRAHTKDGVFGEYYVATDPVWVENMVITDPEGKSEGSVERGRTLQLKAEITPANASFTEVSWSVEGIHATVDQTGIVTPLTTGSVVVKATVQASTIHPLTATYKLTVLPASVEGVEVVPSSLTITEGKTQKLTARLIPAEAADPGILWSSTNTQVATISSDGLLTALMAGKTKVYAYTADGSGKFGTCDVTVEEDKTLKGINLSSEVMDLKVGDSKTLTVIYNPSYAANKNVTWTTSNASVATVDGGVVTAKEAGQAIVTATSEEGGFKASCTVNVSATLPSGTKLFYCDVRFRDLYMNGELKYKDVHAYTVSGDDIYTYRTSVGFMKNGIKMKHDAIPFYYTEGLTYEDLTVVGGKLYALVNGGKYSYLKYMVVDLATGSVKLEDVASEAPYSSGGFGKCSMSVASDGTIYVLATFTDEFKQTSSRQWKIDPSGKVEQTIFFTETKNIDRTGMSTGDAYSTSIISSAIDGNDIYCLVYRDTVKNYTYYYEACLFKNGTLVRTYDNFWNNGGCFMAVNKGSVVVTYITFDGVSRMMRDGDVVYSNLKDYATALCVDSKGDIYYSLYDNVNKYRVFKNSTVLYSSENSIQHMMVVE